jgi:hypothetical protein
MRFRLDDPPFHGRTGRGVTVAVVDSGIHGAHPHVGGISGGLSLVAGSETNDLVDRIGHGTAIAGAIRDKGPDVALLAVKVFDRQLTTTAEMLARAITWSADHGARLINSSLGTANLAREEILRAAVEHAVSRGALVVAARELDGVPWLPGALPGVIGVDVDWALERDELEIVADTACGARFRACGFPRPIPGVARERNLSGISFAVANVTGFLSRGVEACGWSVATDVARDLRGA